MTDCFNNTAVLGCYDDLNGNIDSVVIHYTYDGSGAPAVRITDLAGTVIAGADLTNTTVGACVLTALPSPDVETLILCDQAADGSTTSFIRRTVTSFNTFGAVTTSAVADFALDGTTVYAVVGTVVNCPACNPLDVAQRGLQTAW
jgi:hypothetical protein